MHRLTRKHTRIALSLLLAILIAIGTVPASVFANAPADISESQASGNLAETHSEPDAKSERRQNYEQLLEGNYFAVELIQKFHELFGDEYTALYIRENYADIFDVAPDEIDEGFLNIIANVEHEGEEEYLRAMQSDSLNFQLSKDIGMIDDLFAAVENPTPEIPKSAMLAPKVIPGDQFQISDGLVSDEQLSDEMISEELASGEQLSEELASDEQLSEELIPSDSAIGAKAILGIGDAGGMAIGGDIQAAAMAASSSLNSITNVAVTNTSISFDLNYVRNNDINNTLAKFDHSSQSWSTLLGFDGTPAATSRRYTASGLVAGGVYTFSDGTEVQPNDN
jgi:hypothetical protein